MEETSNMEGKAFVQGGREVLIKATTFLISIYAMGCFKFLRRLCDELEALMARLVRSERRREENSMGGLG